MTDPVCGMTVDPARAYGPVAHDGVDYYFCNPDCERRFRADPLRYLRGEREPHEVHNAPVGPPTKKPSSEKATRYICPMDPDVESPVPGACPKCGMALVPEAPGPDDGPDPETVDFTRRLVWGAVVGVPVIVLAMLDMLPSKPFHEYLSMRANLVIQLVLSVPVVFWSGWPIFYRAVASVKNVSPNMFALIALGVFAAFAYSVGDRGPGWFPAGSPRHGV